MGRYQPRRAADAQPGLWYLLGTFAHTGRLWHRGHAYHLYAHCQFPAGKRIYQRPQPQEERDGRGFQRRLLVQRALFRPGLRPSLCGGTAHRDVVSPARAGPPVAPAVPQFRHFLPRHFAAGLAISEHDGAPVHHRQPDCPGGERRDGCHAGLERLRLLGHSGAEPHLLPDDDHGQLVLLPVAAYVAH